MKKYSLLIAILIVICLFMLLTWTVPASVIGDHGIVNNGYNPMGIFDLIMLPLTFFDYSNYALVTLTDKGSINAVSYANIVLGLLSIGIFYKVLNKTGAYGKLIQNLKEKLKNNKLVFIVISIAIFTLLSAFTGLSLLLFLLVPFFVTLLLKLNFSKITALSSTVLPILVGRICSITAWDITGINNQVYGVKWQDDLIIRIILLVLFLIFTTVYVLLSKSPKSEIEEDPMNDEVVNNEKSFIPLVVVSGLFFIIMAVCMYNWYYIFDNASITESYNSIMSNSVNGYPFVQNFLGTLEPFGYWSGFSMSAMLLILSGLLGFLYSISFNELVEAGKDGVKKMAKPALYVVLACVITTFLSNMVYNFEKNETVFFTIADWVNKYISFDAVPFSTVFSGIFGLFVNNYTIVSLQTYPILSFFFSDNIPTLSVLCMQVFHGIMGIITPTSIFLVAGLSYLDISYKNWLSYIWKFFVIIFVLALLIVTIVSIV